MSFPPIAVVGLGGVFPGARSPRTFWQNVVAGQVAARRVPPERWVLPVDWALDRPLRDRVASPRACLVDQFEFDTAGLQIPLDPSQLDPLYLYALEAARMAWAEGAHPGLERRRVGVSLASIALPTDRSSQLSHQLFGQVLGHNAYGDSQAYPVTVSPWNRQVVGLPASLVAASLGLGGASLTLDAACASSLYAVKLACDELNAGRADAMLAGGASRPDCLYTQMGFTALGALSSTGVCAPFDARGDGLVVGEGAGILLLKRLDDAVSQGDTIYGVIRGIGLSNDVGGSLLAPNSEGQLRAMRDAYRQSGWQPEEVDLVECHGTGTPMGDRMEFLSLLSLWEGRRFTPGQCALGSVKSMIGHLLTGAGAAGLIKVLFALKEKTLPPTANFERPARGIELEGSPFRMQQQSQPWEEKEWGRRAAVSAFGFGGINGHVLLEEWNPRRRPASVARKPSREPVAIVAAASRFGELKTLESFFESVLAGESAVGPLPASRWNGAEDLLPVEALPGCYVEKLEIPVGKFRLPPHDVPGTLCQQLLMLEVAAEAARKSGLDRKESKLRSGAFIGISLDAETTNFHLRWSVDAMLGQGQHSDAELDSIRDSLSPPLDAVRTLGALGSIVASRVARELSLGGPSFAVSGHAASGLKALEIAVRALQQGELDSCLVGAVDLAGDPRHLWSQDQLQPYARDGVGRPFQSGVSGPPVGEGAVALVLKRLSDAEREGDSIVAVVRGLGAGSGEDGYRLALERAYQDADVSPSSIGLLETHGSGVPDEDDREAEALQSFFKEGPALALGVTTPFVGHTGAVTGLAALAKAAKCLEEQTLAPVPGFAEPRHSWSESRFFFPRRSGPWFRNREEGPRRAGVSCIGSLGEVTHVVLEQPPNAPERLQRKRRIGAAIFVVDREHLDRLESVPGRDVFEKAAHWWRTQPAVSHPVALVARNARELEHALSEARKVVSDGRRRLGEGGVFYNPEPLGGQVAFVYPGSGNHYLGMSHGLGVAFPEVMWELDRTTERLADHMVPSLLAPYRRQYRPGWERESLAAVEGDAHATIFGQVMAGVVATRVVEAFGLKPEAVIGYSLGETAGFFSSRAWPERDKMFRRTVGSDLFTRRLSGQCTTAKELLNRPDFEWTVAVVNRPAEHVKKVLEGSEAVDLLIVNTPTECVIGGDREPVRLAVAALGGEAFYLQGVPTVHCELLKPAEEDYYQLHLQTTEPPSNVRFYSGNWGRAYELNADSAARSITNNARYGIDYPKTIESAYQDGVRIFLEMGPQGSCSRMIDSILGERPHLARSLSLAGEDETVSLLKLLAAAAAEGLKVDLSVLYSNSESETTESGSVITVRPGQDLPRKLERPVLGPAPAPSNGKPIQAPAPPPAAPTPVPVTSSTPQLQPIGAVASPVHRAFLESAHATAAAHEQFLEYSRNSMAALAEAVNLQQEMVEKLLAGQPVEFQSLVTPQAPPRVRPHREQVAFDREACMEFAVGSIEKVLGPMFAEVDGYPVRVRLPDEPLMLCDRILEIEGEPGSLTGGRLVTEHDVFHDAWYLDAGRTPVCISVEAGQADLFLCSYLGIDLAVKGKRAYRLLDATVQFHRGLPQPGETILYDIRIHRFVRQNEVYLFFFEFDGFIEGKRLITMREGCAGFFTTEEIKNSGGIVLTPEERQPATGKRIADWRPLAPSAGIESYSDQQVAAFRNNDLVGCFGQSFAHLPLAKPYGLPKGRMKLFDRITHLDPAGGRFGLGNVRAEADIHPDDWFLTCHFVDDMVMPGTLMYECCAHTLRFLLARMGWVAEESEVAFEPVLETPAALKCRGPVTVDTQKVVYSVDIKEIGYNPQPYVIADAMMYGDGEAIVRFVDMSMQLTGVTRERVESLWSGATPPLVPPASPLVPAAPASHQASAALGASAVLYDKESIMQYSNGKPSLAFGEPYKVFDEERRIARLPGPPYQFMDRVVEVNQEPFVLKPGGWIEVHYDVPPDAWYFGANRQHSMAYCILLEAALQPCGWLAAYCGSALRSSQDMHFRNLGGKATLYKEFFPDVGTVRMRVRMTDVNEAGGMIIENFDMEMWVGEELYYEGTTYFGFFSAAALSNQLGVRDAGERRFSPTEKGESFAIEQAHPLSPDDQRVDAGPGLALPGKALLMMDQVDVYLPQGGPKGLGYIQGSKVIDPEEWFFYAHFYQDPVWPGSLGLEAFLQLLKVVAQRRWPELMNTHRFEPIIVGEPHEWIYRGQVIRKNRQVKVEASISEVGEGATPYLKADGFLVVDDLVIYEMRDFGIRLVPH